ncbi:MULTISPECIES: glycolate oxidase subunit GlcF [unclassified Pseudomonas]|uniref:glycolate oxidase subunit GlcF n=1 Tax=unclassified Pseudomonas TaxID=196821 RepID=UPI000CD16BA4|nr:MULTISPECIES: glycolate oxidase subunit GlcF [unclassified Pseudomonas]POA33876.1 glycolate oxidase iron-sulfur subunit [Pseudomonas sp. GW456-R21]POA65940.1 glycolate oxidase iron-sulfur subunit [Pseudomonas sp. GW460-R15]
MQTTLSDQAKRLPRAAEAESILRTCVHCGFCNATCPTYQLLGDELDGPRGRIYLIKQVLEGNPATAQTQLHLDRCLSCRACETTCPSGVDYHNLLDIGRAVVDQAVPRSASQRVLRQGLRAMAPNPGLFKALLQIGATFRPLMPRDLEAKLPRDVPPAGNWPTTVHARKVLMLEGCVQPGLSPNTNAAAARVLDRLGISVSSVHQAGCCGALDYHLDAQEQGLNRARQNIDAWWPALESGAEAIVQTASGCGAFIKDYGHLLKTDPAYAAKAKRISEMSKDLVEILRNEPLERVCAATERRIAFHCPCTLQHALKLGGAVEELLTRLGFNLTSVPDSHLCCGSAGTYSLTQPVLARQLRDNRLNALESGRPELIVTANIGCQSHLASAGRTPVRHWIELVDQMLR